MSAEIRTIKLVEAEDRDTGIALMINGKCVGSSNYDEHGSGGMILIENIAEKLSDITNIKVEHQDVPDDEFLNAIMDGE